MIQIRDGLLINENHIDGIEQAARLNEDGRLYAATVFHMAGGREFVIEREEYQKIKEKFEPLTQAEQWAKWDAEDKDQKHAARIEMSHYIPEVARLIPAAEPMEATQSSDLPTIADIVDQYIATVEKEIGRDLTLEADGIYDTSNSRQSYIKGILKTFYLRIKGINFKNQSEPVA